MLPSLNWDFTGTGLSLDFTQVDGLGRFTVSLIAPRSSWGLES